MLPLNHRRVISPKRDEQTMLISNNTVFMFIYHITNIIVNSLSHKINYAYIFDDFVNLILD